MPLSDTQIRRYRPPSLRRTIALWLAVFVGCVTVFELLFGGSDAVVTEQPTEAKSVTDSKAALWKTRLEQAEREIALDAEAARIEAQQEAKAKENAVASQEPADSEKSVETPTKVTDKESSPKKILVAKPVADGAAQAEKPAEPQDVATDDVDKDVEADGKQPQPVAAKHNNVTLRGRIVWLNETLKRRYNIATPEDAAEQMLVLEADNGTIHPIVEDTRGGAFRLDDRLRGRPVEVLARRFIGSPMLQVIRLYAVREDGLYELDYWCDICAIQMFQHGVCDCCQGDNRLRERKHDAE